MPDDTKDLFKFANELEEEVQRIARGLRGLGNVSAEERHERCQRYERAHKRWWDELQRAIDKAGRP